MRISIVPFMLLILVTSVKTQAQIAVIANKSLNVSTLTLNEIADIYSLETTVWKGGQSISVFELKGNSPEKEQFYLAMGKSYDNFKKGWLRAKLSGEGNPPKALMSEEEMIESVRNTAGAIGFIRANKVTEAVKVLYTVK
jgi:ABC-type phosphate transport system substrate-binding protein